MSTDAGPGAWVDVMMGVVTGEAEHRALVEDLFRTAYGELVGLATLVTGDRETGEDLAQDAFAGLLRRGPLDDPDAAVGYLRRAVVNGARGRLRRRAVAERPHRADPPPGRAASVEDAALASDDARAVAQALARLPLRQRECVAVCTLLGLSHREAAALLGVSAGSVKTHVHRGTRRLAHLLADRAPTPEEKP
jgi:RNA polymerase sigma factor (sigma-70 family)